jgi:single-strand DNA-binding protein
MAGSVNKVILIGNLGKDPEVKYLESGIPVAKFSIATSETFKDKNTGEKREVTDWHNIVLWRGLATVAENYLKKGMKVYIEGKLKTRSWQDENNQTKYATDVVADQMTMLSSKAEFEGQPKSNYPDSVEKVPVQKAEADLTSAADDDLPF